MNRGQSSVNERLREDSRGLIVISIECDRQPLLWCLAAAIALPARGYFLRVVRLPTARRRSRHLEMGIWEATPTRSGKGKCY
jgi:hypothetical protein